MLHSLLHGLLVTAAGVGTIIARTLYVVQPPHVLSHGCVVVGIEPVPAGHPPGTGGKQVGKHNKTGGSGHRVRANHNKALLK